MDSHKEYRERGQRRGPLDTSIQLNESSSTFICHTFHSRNNLARWKSGKTAKYNMEEVNIGIVSNFEVSTTLELACEAMPSQLAKARNKAVHHECRHLPKVNISKSHKLDI